MKKKLLSLILSFGLVIALLPLTALAKTSDEPSFGSIYVGDVKMDSSNGAMYATTDANRNVTIQKEYEENDPWNVKYSGNTLVLRNANIQGDELLPFLDGQTKAGILKAGILLFNEEILELIEDKNMENVPTIHLQLEGDNFITTSDILEEGDTINSGISAINLEISGNGSLTITAGAGVASIGIFSYWNLTVNNGKISCSGGKDSYMSGGIMETVGTLVMNGGQLTAKGGPATEQSFGIWANKTIISGGSLTAMGEGGNSRAIIVGDNYISPLAGTSIIAKSGNTKENAQPLQGFPFTSEVNITSQINDKAYFHSYVNVTDVTVSPSAVQVQKGQTQQFSAATMSGQVTVDTDVRWIVEGASAADTTISKEGLLMVSSKETAKALTVRAIYDCDESKSGTAVVTVTEPLDGKNDASNNLSNQEKSSSNPVKAVFQDTATKNTYKITGNGKNTVEFIGNTSKNKKIVKIPNTVVVKGVHYSVTSIANNAFKNNKKLTTIVIGKNVTKIGKKAFWGCKNLKKITIQSTKLKKNMIGTKAFAKAGSKNYGKLKVVVPKKCRKTYKKIFRQKGLSTKAVVK